MSATCCDHPLEGSTATCTNCDTPVCGNCMAMVNDMPICASCADTVEELSRREKGSVLHLLPAMCLGLAASVLCAFIWAAISIGANYQIGYAAIGLGWLTGMAVHLGAGKKRSILFQIAAAGLSIFGLLLAKFMIVFYIIVQHATKEGYDASYFDFELILLSIQLIPDTFSGFDILWVIFAVGAAWRVAAPTEVSIQRVGARRSSRRRKENDN